MVMAEIVGHIWELPRLSCLRWTHFRNLPGGGGKRGPTRGGNFVLPTYWLRREVVGEGALRGRSPRTREGRIGPTAQLQWSVVSGQWLVARDGATAESELFMRLLGRRSDLRRGEVRPHFGMRSPGAVQMTRRRCWACGNYRGGWRSIRLPTVPAPRSSRRLPIRSRKAQPLIPVGTGPTAVVETCEKD